MSEGRNPLDIGSVPLSGVQLIEASAGTGKTYTITSLFLRALVELGEPLERIAAVTFTNAATAELRDRVGQRLVAARAALLPEAPPSDDALLRRYQEEEGRDTRRRIVERALADVDRASIFTIHGFAQRLLSDFTFESGARYEVELLPDQSSIVYDATVDFWSSRVGSLDAEELRALGGPEIFSQLVQVAKVAASSPELPLVEVARLGGLHRELERLQRPYDEARGIFAREKAKLIALLDSGALNRKSYSRERIDKDVALWEEYFSFDEPTRRLPKDDGRWQQSVVNERVKAASKKLGAPTHRFFELVDELVSIHEELQGLLQRRHDTLRAELATFVRERVARHHERELTQSFDDLLLRLRDVLRDEERGGRVAREMRRRHPILLIDEFQDTDPVQYEIFHRVYATSSTEESDDRGPGLFLIGDPKQSIYSFRGADVHAYLEAANAATQVWTLTTSYRSGPTLVRAQNTVFQRNLEPFGTRAIRYEPILPRPGRTDRLLDSQGEVLPGLTWIGLESSRDLLVQTAREIAHFLAAGHRLGGRPVRAGNLAVLTRRNADALEIQRQLARRGIPAVMHGDRSVFEQPEALELRRVLLALAEPSHSQLVRAALATRLVGLDAKAIHELDRDDAELERWVGKFRTRSEEWKQHGLVHALEGFERDVNLAARTLADFDGERRLTNYRHLVELLHEAEVRLHLGQAGLIRSLESAIEDPMGHEMAAESKQLRLDSDDDAVTLTTIHKSKGLEYDIVFLAGLGAIRYRDPSAAFRFHESEGGQQRLELRTPPGCDDSNELAQREDLEEALRLSYVALTRAKDHVVALVPPPYRGGSPLIHQLLPLPSGDWQAALENWTVDNLSGPLQELVAASAGSISLQAPRPGEAGRYERGAALVQLTAAPLPAALPEAQRTSSFSAMTRHGSRLSRSGREGRDIDEQDRPAEARRAESRGGVNERGGANERSGANEWERVVLADFPRGAGPGEALHAVFETSDFAEGSPEQRRERVVLELARRGIAEEHVDATALGIEQVLQTQFGDAGVQLGALTRRTRRAEMEFAFPVAGADSRLSASSLADALGLGEAGSTLPQSYLAEIAHLGFHDWWGFLRGFIDLVFEWEGRFYVADYKSNYLGESYADYGPSACQQAMEEHHYPLQAYLYALAVHRHLQHRLAGYEYERHFGGVYYLFVRGMRPGETTGVQYLRPSLAEMERLSSAFGAAAIRSKRA
ncbi:MAG TPA: exodeoxyribonuclease V subunit beta [Polyangiaceae bacterium]|nr:exodeoxyribonuclease V subunit beta [Polyangiaceae bacterium]